MDKLYNPLKLSEYRHLFPSKQVLVVGGGAVGSNVAEDVVKMGASVDVIDFDTFTLENAAKHSCLVRTPEDVGRNKAECVSSRLKPLLEEGCHTNGIDTDLCMLGPEAIAEYDVVILCVDNFATKTLFNELWMKIPKERRPYVIMDGTHDEMAQSVILDGKEFCLDCLMDDSWMKDANIRTSCSGPQLRRIDGNNEIVRTSGLASSIAANLSSEQFRAIVIGAPDVVNRRITYTAYPHFEMSVAKPMRKRTCSGCKTRAPQNINWLSGSVLDLTLGEALKQIGAVLNSDEFEVSTHRLNYKKVLHSGFIINDTCHSCGKTISVMKHEGRTYLDDLLCDECKANNKVARNDTSFIPGTTVYAFTPDCSEELKQKTLFELGYPLGAHIEVIERNGALDFLDADKIAISTFACQDDPKKMHVVNVLK